MIDMKRLLTTLTTLLLTLTVMAQAFDNLPTPGEEKVIDNTPDSIAKALMSRPAPGSTRKDKNPVLFLIGNSTMRNGTLGNGNNGQWGWGYFFNKYFDGRKISVENQALGGMSTRTFYTDLWPAVRDALKPGDWVIVSIGHNDHADFFDAKRARGVIDGVDPDTMLTGFNERKQMNDTVYSYGNYLRRYIAETRAKGANPILMSLTPRDAYDPKTGKYEARGSVDAWSKKAYPTNPYENDKPFPQNIDAVGDGFVYFIDDEGFAVSVQIAGVVLSDN